MALLQRLVRDVQASTEGQLVASGIWHLEPARGEVRLHRELTHLVDATDGQIARFASIHGLLGQKRSEYIHSAASTYWSEQVMRLAQSRAADLEALATAVRGSSSDLPAGTEDLAAALTWFAAAIPTPLLEYMREAFVAESLPDLPQLSEWDLQGALLPIGQDPPRPDAPPPPEKLRLAAELFELMAHDMATARGPRFDPAAASFAALVSSLMAAAPDFLTFFAKRPPETGLTEESASDWRRVAGELQRWVELVRLVRRARDGGVNGAERTMLSGLASVLLQLDLSPALTAAELADRIAPIAEIRVEEDMRVHGAWPPPRSVPLPTYVRAVVALWEELTDEPAPRGCVTAGCHSVIPGRSKARYCERCRRRRQANRVRSRRRLPDKQPLSGQ